MSEHSSTRKEAKLTGKVTRTTQELIGPTNQTPCSCKQTNKERKKMSRGGGVTILLLVLAAILSEATLNGTICLWFFFFFFFFFFLSLDAASLVSLNLPYTLSVADVVSGPNCFPSQSLLPLCYQIAAQTDCRSAFPLVVAIVRSPSFSMSLFADSLSGECLQRRRFSLRV